MAKQTHNNLAVGITVMIVLALTIYIVVMLADWPNLFTPQQEITVRLPYKSGLKGLIKGSPIHLGGVKIGHITNTGITKLNPTSTDSNDVYVYFTMKMPQQYQLRYDCTLVPQSNVLGGQTLLSIEDLGYEGEPIQNGQTVELLLADSLMEAIKHEFDPDEPNSFLARLKKDVPATIEQLQQTISKADTALDSAKSALDSARSAMQNLKQITGDERVDRILGNINSVSINLKLTSQEVRRAPWKLLYKPKEKEFRIQTILDSAGAFAAGAERLDTAAMRLHNLVTAAGEKLQVDKNRIESIVSELEASFEQFQKVEQKFWEELK